MKKLIRIIMVSLIFAFLFSGCGNKEAKLIGSYYKTIDETDYARLKAKEYLSDAWMAEQVDTSQYFNDITVSVNVLLYSDDTYEEILDEASYDEAIRKANESLGEALLDLVMIRAKAQGIELENRDAVNDLMIEKAGMTAEDYISKYGPLLLPDKENMSNSLSSKGSFALTKEAK